MPHAPFELVNGLHPMMPIEYLLTTIYLPIQGSFLFKIFTKTMLKLEKLDEYGQKAIEITRQWQWNHVLWAHQHYKNKSSTGDYVL
jgi:hypothetical protein